MSQPVTNPLGNLVSAVMTLGAPTRDGTPLLRQPVPVSQSQPLQQQPPIYKPQQPFQLIPPQPQPQLQPQQPQPQQYQYQDGEPIYDDEDEGLIPNHPMQQNQQCNRGRGPSRRYQQQQQQQQQGQRHYNELYDGNFIPPLYFAQPIGQSVASHFQPREYDDASPIYFPENADSQVEIRPQRLGVLPEFRGYKQDDPYNHLYEFLAIANANIPRNTNRNIFRLTLFPFTLKDKAKYWFTSLQPNSITNWEKT